MLFSLISYRHAISYISFHDLAKLHASLKIAMLPSPRRSIAYIGLRYAVKDDYMRGASCDRRYYY